MEVIENVQRICEILENGIRLHPDRSLAKDLSRSDVADVMMLFMALSDDRQKIAAIKALSDCLLDQEPR